MTSRCWEELRRAGKALGEDPAAVCSIVGAVALDFELPQSPEAAAVGIFLTELLDALPEPFVEFELPEAAE
jgi:hypothetical protein